MARDSVLPDWALGLDDLKSLGREELVRLQNEAGRRLNNQRQIYGPDYRPGRQRFLQDSLQSDIKRIREALGSLNLESGERFRPSNPEGSREEIAERLVTARRNALIFRNDEGVDEADSRAAAAELRAAKAAARELDEINDPLTSSEETDAKKRIADRTNRMRHGVHRVAPKDHCPNCRSAILAESKFCPRCAHELVTKVDRAVFLSHASENKQWTELLRKHLHNRGFESWLDARELVAGDALTTELTDAISNAQVFIFVVSKASATKTWPLQELRLALDLQKERGNAYRVIPLVLDPDAIPAELADVICVNAHAAGEHITFGTDQSRQMLDHLIQSINGVPVAP